MSEDFKVLYSSPIGEIELTGSEDGIKSLYFADEKIEEGKTVENKFSGKINDSDASCLKECLCQLDEYFMGKRKSFSLNLIPEGTEFQKKVWKELMNIPYGETISYLELSRRIGDIKAIRAVGGANGRNKISIIIPCHRVIGENGKLIGYGGGLWRKRWLLNHEGSLGELNF